MPAVQATRIKNTWIPESNSCVGFQVFLERPEFLIAKAEPDESSGERGERAELSALAESGSGFAELIAEASEQGQLRGLPVVNQRFINFTPPTGTHGCGSKGAQRNGDPTVFPVGSLSNPNKVYSIHRPQVVAVHKLVRSFGLARPPERFGRTSRP